MGMNHNSKIAVKHLEEMLKANPNYAKTLTLAIETIKFLNEQLDHKADVINKLNSNLLEAIGKALDLEEKCDKLKAEIILMKNDVT